MVYRISSKVTKGRFFCICLFLILIFTMLYFYLTKAQENYKRTKWVEKRCISELSSVKYQLDVVTEYKAHVESVLAECQKAHNIDKERFKDITESCVTMKQQSSLCQNQFDDLQSECKKVKEIYNREKSEMEKLKEHLEEEIRGKELTQKTIDELFGEIEILRKTNEKLLHKLQQSQTVPESSPKNFKRQQSINNRSFSEIVEISPGEYEYTIRPPNSTMDNKTDNSNIQEINVANNDRLNKRTVQNEVPPGFAPILPVQEIAEIPNLPKPPRDINGNIESNKLDDQKNKNIDLNRMKDKDLEIVDLQDSRINSIVNDNEGLKLSLDTNEKPLEDDPNNAQEVNQPAQEDDDEGEEYGP